MAYRYDFLSEYIIPQLDLHNFVANVLLCLIILLALVQPPSFFFSLKCVVCLKMYTKPGEKNKYSTGKNNCKKIYI